MHGVLFLTSGDEIIIDTRFVLNRNMHGVLFLTSGDEIKNFR